MIVDPNEDKSLDDHIRQQVLNLQQRDSVQQIVLDPHLGMLKREIHFGITDYLTVRLDCLVNLIDIPKEEEVRGVDECLGKR